MFKDAKEELDRIQEELLAEETPEPREQDEDILSEDTLDMLLDVDYRAYNADNADVDPQELSQEVLKPESPSLTGLVITAGVLTVGIFLVLCWWLIRYLGVL